MGHTMTAPVVSSLRPGSGPRTRLRFRPRFRLLLACLCWLGLSALGGWAVYQAAEQAALEEVQDAGRNRLALYATSLQREIDKYAFFPGIVALQADVQAVLAQPGNAALQLKANTYLEQLSSRAGTLSVYLVDRSGHVLASSNWRRPDSFVGEDLSFRPYVQQALQGGSGRYFGIGTTRGEPGYYLTSTVNSGEGQDVGVAVVKVGLAQLEQSWATAESPVWVSDENSVLILSNVPAWRFATLTELDAAQRARLQSSQQYNRRSLKPLGWKLEQPLEDRGTGQTAGAQLLHIAQGEQDSPAFSSGQFLLQSKALAGTPWTLSVLSPTEASMQLAQSRAWVAAVVIALILLLAAQFYQRRKHAREQLAARQRLQQAYAVLESKVEQRTADLQAANTALQQEVGERIQAEATLRAAQNELVHAGKLAVIGQISTEVAHELNQPLAALRTLAGNSQRFLERGQHEVVRSNLQRMADLADRMGRITGQLRNFARKSFGKPAAVELDKALDAALAVLEARIARSGAIVVRKSASPPVMAWCDAGRVEQVLVNLLGNALDSMQEQALSGRRPCVELECARNQQWAQITVRDHGPGLSEQAASHLFEPFFTTKPEGQGLGLGLSLSANIAQASGGMLQGRNHPEGGAVFTLLLPLADTQPLA